MRTQAAAQLAAAACVLEQAFCLAALPHTYRQVPHQIALPAGSAQGISLPKEKKKESAAAPKHKVSRIANFWRAWLYAAV